MENASVCLPVVIGALGLPGSQFEESKYSRLFNSFTSQHCSLIVI